MTSHLDVVESLIAGTGFLFAQVVVGIADCCCAMGVPFHMPRECSFSTVELETNFLGSARTGE
jgi:acyl-coenzyme A thioesterase PaaI-like protein